MHRIPLLLLSAVGFVSAGWSLAHVPDDGERVKVLGSQDIVEKVDGENARVTIVEVTIEAGEEGQPHRHPGPGFVYVAEGTYELEIDDQPTKVFQAGEKFYEPTGCLHRVSRNPSPEGRTRLIAVVLHPRTTTAITVPLATETVGK